MSRIKELQEKRAQAHAEATTYLQGEQNAEKRASFDKGMAVVDALAQDIKNIERADAAEAELRAAGAVKTAPIAGTPGVVDAEKLAKEYRRAFVASLRTMAPNQGFGPEATNRIERSGLRTAYADILDRGVQFEKESRADGDGILEGSITGRIGTYSGLGYFVPQGFVNDIEQAEKYFAPLLDGTVLNVIETASGQPLPFPTSNDTAQKATVIGEAYAVSEQDVTASQIIFGAIKMTSGLVKTSTELMQDSAFNLDSWLVQRFAERWGRGLETELTTGIGGTHPTGLLTAIAASGASPVTALGANANSGLDGDTNVNSIGYQDLVNLEHSVDPAYRNGARYMLHDTTLASLKRILDKFGRPIWAPGVGVGVGDTLNGYKYVINQSMPAIAASAVTLVFGDLKKFTVRKVKDLSVMKLVERYAEQGQIGFVSFARVDSNLLDAGTHPVNVLQQHS